MGRRRKREGKQDQDEKESIKCGLPSRWMTLVQHLSKKLNFYSNIYICIGTGNQFCSRTKEISRTSWFLRCDELQLSLDPVP